MRHRLSVSVVAVVVAAVGAAGAVAAPNERAGAQCFAAFLQQYEGGVAAGGGPKNAAACAWRDTGDRALELRPFLASDRSHRKGSSALGGREPN